MELEKIEKSDHLHVNVQRHIDWTREGNDEHWKTVREEVLGKDIGSSSVLEKKRIGLEIAMTKT